MFSSARYWITHIGLVDIHDQGCPLNNTTKRINMISSTTDGLVLLSIEAYEILYLVLSSLIILGPSAYKVSAEDIFCSLVKLSNQHPLSLLLQHSTLQCWRHETQHLLGRCLVALTTNLSNVYEQPNHLVFRSDT
jgi:hypothetical protein